MAEIEYIRRSASAIDVRIIKLDETYNGTTRIANWWYGADNEDVNYLKPQPLSNQISSSPSISFTNLNPSTKYCINCTIQNINDGDLKPYSVALDSITVWTLDPIPLVGVSRTYDSEQCADKEAMVHMKFFDVVFGVSKYQIQARKQGTSTWYNKGSEYFVDADEVIKKITFDEYATYEVRVKVWTPGPEGDFEDQILPESAWDVVTFVIEKSPLSMTCTYGEWVSFETIGVRDMEIKWKTYANSNYGVGYDVSVVRLSDGEEVYYSRDNFPSGIATLAQEYQGTFGVDDYEVYQFHLNITIYQEMGDNGWTSVDDAHCYQNYQPLILQPNINSLNCVTSEKNIVATAEISATTVDNEYTSYQISARQFGTSVWYTKTSDFIKNMEHVGYSYIIENSFGVNEYADYEIKLSVITSDGIRSMSSEKVVQISVMDKGVLLWEWDTTYTDSDNVNGSKITICPRAYIPISPDGQIQPVTALSWNKFTSRINALRIHLGLATWDFSVDNTEEGAYGVYKNLPFTKEIYNNARSAIQDIGHGAGSLIPEMDNDTPLRASLFTVLKDELNAAIQNL